MGGRELKRAERIYVDREQVWVPSMPWAGMDHAEKVYIKRVNGHERDAKEEETYFLFGEPDPSENWDP